jgi:hypothetical protein
MICCSILCYIKVRSNIHPNQKTIRSILLSSGKVASVLISTSCKHMDNHCHLVYLSVRWLATWRKNSDNQTLGIIIYQYYIEQYVRDNILHIQCLLIQHMPYVKTKHLNPTMCGHLYFDIYNFTTSYHFIMKYFTSCMIEGWPIFMSICNKER